MNTAEVSAFHWTTADKWTLFMKMGLLTERQGREGHYVSIQCVGEN
jgi:hypothetical protein